MQMRGAAKSHRAQQLCVGTSGFSYGHWRGVFYPEKLPQRKWLAHYMERFRTVEINSTFYHLPRESTMVSWREQAPDGFVFALKASRVITHIQLLSDAQETLELFLSRARLLEDHLGPVLFQLPPRFKREAKTVESFLELLPRDLVVAFEFRDESWYCEQTFELLGAHGACFCTHDMPGLWTPRRGTGPAAYVRFHGPARRYRDSYSDEALAEWAEWMSSEWKAGRSLYAYFNNDIGGHAVNNAKTLGEMLQPLTG